MSLPKFLKPYFWDVEFIWINEDRSKYLIVKRIMDMGNMKAVRWALNNYQLAVFKYILKNSRDISPKSANFWALHFDIPRNQVKCLSKHYIAQWNKLRSYENKMAFLFS